MVKVEQSELEEEDCISQPYLSSGLCFASCQAPVFILHLFPTCLSLCAALVLGVTMATEESIIRIPPYHYIHVLDQNSNVSHVEVGPKTYIRQDNERLL